MKLEGRIRQESGDVRTVSAEGDYEAAAAEVRANVGSGEYLLSLRRLD